jgi:hypothetical protein
LISLVKLHLQYLRYNNNNIILKKLHSLRYLYPAKIQLKIMVKAT